MSFCIRNIQESDLEDLFGLASQFTLLNLPADKKILARKIEISQLAFQRQIAETSSEYLFVMEDLERKRVVGASQIIAKHGTPDLPHYYFKIEKKNMFSKALGVGFIHQVLKLKDDKDGPTEIGGLLIDKEYRGRPEKLGRQMSLVRFLFMGMFPELFQERILCELSPPLTSEGRSEFWEALGRRFTGMSYVEADQLSQQYKEFISTLFPHEDIYLCLLDSKARLMVGRVAEETSPARHFLEQIGFEYLNEVDPFDGGPHWGAKLKDISIIKKMKRYVFSGEQFSNYSNKGLVASFRPGFFRSVAAGYSCKENQMFCGSSVANLLQLSLNDKVFVYSKE